MRFMTSVIFGHFDSYPNSCKNQNKVYRVSKRYKIAGSVDQNIGLRDLKKLVQTL